MTISLNAAQIVRSIDRTKLQNKGRVNVISESLCDDILKRLGPSLKPYKGCVIVDHYPGASLFSRKIHEALKPKAHVLYEPDYAGYKSLIDPLLAQPGSKYHLRTDKTFTRYDPESCIEDGIIPEKAPPGETTLHLINGTHARIVNRYNERTKVSSRTTHGYINDARTAGGYHARGASRVLLWCTESEKLVFLPRSASSRKKTAMYLEAYSKAQEVVGFGDSQYFSKRWTKLVDEGCAQVARRSKKLRIPPVPHRDVRPRAPNIHDAPIPRAWHQELRDLENDLLKGPFRKHPERLNMRFRDMRRQGIPMTLDDDWVKYRDRKFRLDSENRQYAEVHEISQLQVGIDKLDRQSYDLDPANHKGRQRLVQQQEQLRKTLDSRLALLRPNQQTRYHQWAADQFVFYRDPQLLSWDRREYEPLTAQKDEFYPAGELALIDLQPILPCPMPVTVEQAIFMDTMASHLFLGGASKNVKYLSQLAPGAYEALAPKIPELRDIRQGGRSDYLTVANRVLPPVVFWRLALAWDAWPFKPALCDSFTSVSPSYYLRSEHGMPNLLNTV